MLEIENLIRIFFCETDKDLLYNEFSLQFELGCFFRKHHKKVIFEKNIKDLKLNKKNFIKKEIDLIICNGCEKIAIELKFPIKENGQTPEQMFNFIKDIKFIEQLVESEKFDKGFFIILTDSKLFWDKEITNKKNKLYKTFRSENIKINGKYKKPTGQNKEEIEIEIKNKYEVEWKNAKNKRRYFCIKIEK